MAASKERLLVAWKAAWRVRMMVVYWDDAKV